MDGPESFVTAAGESEAMLRAFVQEAPLAIAIFDREMRYLVASRRWLSDNGCKEADLLGRSHYEVFPKISSAWREVHQRCLAGAVESSPGVSYVREDGTVHWVRWECRPWFSLPEVIGGIVLFTEDITPRQQAEQALRTSEERLRLMIDGLKDYALFMIDPSGRIVSWNLGAERLLGYREEEILGQSFVVLYALEERDPEVLQHKLRAAAETGSEASEGWRLRKDGSRFWGSGTLSRVSDGEELVGFTKVIRDISERRHSTELLKSVLDSALDGIVSIDEAGIIQSVNRATVRLFGYAADEIVGRNVAILMPGPHHDAHEGYLRNFLGGGEAKVIGIGRRVPGRRKDGSVFPLELSVTEFQLEKRRFFTGVLRDLTERNRLEHQLRQSQKMEAIGLLAGGVAHDFNNLLTVINGYGELLIEDSTPDDPQRHIVSEILKAGQRAATLTRQLLAFSRRQLLEPRIVDLNEVVASSQRLLGRLIGEDILLAAVLDPRLSPVRVDPGQMEQVLLNLAVNARDAMPQGGRLTLETRNAELGEEYCRLHDDIQAGPYVRLAVTDTGCGMTPEVLTHIFEPFFTTKGPGEGTGLGLATVFGIVKQSGGAISAYSEVGVGTSFLIHFPALEEVPAVAHAEEVYSPDLKGSETILLVEDEDAVRRVATHALEARGYQVLTAENGSDALRVLAEHPERVDLVVTDVVMPVMSGRQLAEAVRATHPGARILFMSGYTDDAVVRHGIVRAEESFLQKPFVPLTLARKVREVLDRVVG